MAQLFTVYDTDVDDEGCVRLHVNTDIRANAEAADRLATLIDQLDDSGALADLTVEDEGGVAMTVHSHRTCSDCGKVRAVNAHNRARQGRRQGVALRAVSASNAGATAHRT